MIMRYLFIVDNYIIISYSLTSFLFPLQQNLNLHFILLSILSSSHPILSIYNVGIFYLSK
eukprot:UN02430